MQTADLPIPEKKRLYEQHGMREYWIVDPEEQTVEIFEHTESGFTVDLADLFRQ